MRVLFSILLALAFLGLPPSAARADLTDKEVIVMLNSGYKSSAIEALIHAQGYSGKRDADTLILLKQNGADLDLINLIAFNLKFQNPLVTADVRAKLLQKSSPIAIMDEIDDKGFQGRLTSPEALDLVTYGATSDLIKKIQRAGEEIFDLPDESFLVIGNKPRLVDQSLVFDKAGYATDGGRVLIRPEWEEADRFHSGLARIKEGTNYGYIDKSGALVIPAHFPFAHPFSENRAVITTVPTGDSSFRYITTSGTLLTNDVWDDAKDFSLGRARVETQGKYGYIDSDGKVVIPPKWTSAGDFKEGLAWIFFSTDSGDSRYGYINDKGTMVIPADWEEARDFSNGLAAVKKGGLWGYINPSGKLVIPNKYKEVRNFSESVAAVNVDYLSLDKWVYINSNGELAITGAWLEAGDFNKGLAQVTDSKGQYIMDKSGSARIPQEWTLVKNQPDENLLLVTRHLPRQPLEAAYMDLTGRILWRSE